VKEPKPGSKYGTTYYENKQKHIHRKFLETTFQELG